MRQLRLVSADADCALGASDSSALVLETIDGLERFSLPLDPALRDAVRRPGPAARPAASVPDARVTPREIQRRVRTGEAPDDIAEDTRSTIEWVMRFAQPVLAERARIADEARRAKARRATGEAETVPFGETVDARFAAHGIDPAAVTWDAVKREDGPWALVARWIGGQGEHTAEWTFSLAARTVAAADDTAAELLSDRPIRPIVAAVPSEPVLTVTPPLVPGVVAFPAMPDAHTGPLPRAEDVFDQAHFDAPVATLPPTLRPDGASPLAAAFDEPPLPLGLPGAEHDAAGTRAPARAARGERRTRRVPPAVGEAAVDDKTARAHIPSWDDILLGVRRKQD